MMNQAKSSTFKIVLVGIVLGIILWGGFNTAMEATNTESFCVSCHEMRDTPYKELQKTIHFTNRTGVRATCPDCHVPKQWVYKIVRKIQASNELYHHFMGTVDTPAKFEAKRLQLAKNVWTAMKNTDSRECRNCHNFESMDLDKQESRSADMHEEALQGGKATCIDCHKGIAHQAPAGFKPEWNTPGGFTGQ